MATTAPRLVIGFDLGNTNLTAAVVTGEGEVLGRWREANPREAGALASLAWVEAMLREAVRQYRGGAPRAAGPGRQESGGAFA